MKKILAIFLVIMFSTLALAGCNSSTPNTNTQTPSNQTQNPSEADPEPNVNEDVSEVITELSGKFLLSSMTEDGVTQSRDDLITAGINPDEAYLEFMADGKFQEVFWDDPLETGTYVIEDGHFLELTYADGVVIDAILTGGTHIFFDYEGDSYQFEQSADVQLIGKYTIISMTEDGVTQSRDDLIAAGINPDEAYLEFMEGGKFQEVFWDDPLETGTYEVSISGHFLDLTYDDGVVIEAEINGNEISFDYEGDTYIFERN